MDNQNIILKYSQICKAKNQAVTDMLDSLPENVKNSKQVQQFVYCFNDTIFDESYLIKEILSTRRLKLTYGGSNVKTTDR